MIHFTRFTLIIFTFLICLPPLFGQANFGLFDAALIPETELAKAVQHPAYRNALAARTPATIPDTLRPVWARKAFREHLIELQKDSLWLVLDPLFDFTLGSDNAHSTYTNLRGIKVEGHIGSAVSFQTQYCETQSQFPEWVNRYIQAHHVVPGNTYPKGFKEGGYDYGLAMGSFTVAAMKDRLWLEAGHDRHFIGNGYRSLLLSDFTHPFAFARTTFRLGPLQYSFLLGSLQDLGLDHPYNRPTGAPFLKKSLSVHYLDLQIGPRLNLGLFESVIWPPADSLGKRFMTEALNPLIGSHAILYGLDHEKNVQLGLNLSWKPFSNTLLYGQLLIDNWPASGHLFRQQAGWQAGLRLHHLGGIKHLHLLTEYNAVRPYTYSHSQPIQSYTHFNGPLAHPMEANFKEVLAILRYHFGRWQAEIHLNHAIRGMNPPGENIGSHLFLAGPYDIESQTAQAMPGEKWQLWQGESRLSYVINPANHIRLEAGMIYRKEKHKGTTRQYSYFWGGLKAGLFNRHFDY